MRQECLVATKDPGTLAAWRDPTLASLEADRGCKLEEQGTSGETSMRLLK